MLRESLKSPRVRLALVGGAIAVCALIGVLYWQGISPAEVMQGMRSLQTAVSRMHPAAFTVSAAFLTAVGLPATPFFIMAGFAYGHVQGLIVGTLVLLLNDVLTYWVAARFFRARISRWFHRKGLRMPEVAAEDHVRMVLLARLIPGLPLIAQNYGLGLARVPFQTFLLASLPVQIPVMAAYMLSGGALFEGEHGILFIGISLIVVVGIIGRIVQRRHVARVR